MANRMAELCWQTTVRNGIAKRNSVRALPICFAAGIACLGLFFCQPPQREHFVQEGISSSGVLLPAEDCDLTRLAEIVRKQQHRIVNQTAKELFGDLSSGDPFSRIVTAWEIRRREALQQGGAIRSVSGNDSGSSWFCGYVEGAAGLRVPEDWAAAAFEHEEEKLFTVSEEIRSHLVQAGASVGEVTVVVSPADGWDSSVDVVLSDNGTLRWKVSIPCRVVPMNFSGRGGAGQTVSVKLCTDTELNRLVLFGVSATYLFIVELKMDDGKVKGAAILPY